MQVFATSCAMLLTAAASSVLLQQQIHLQLVLGMTITSIAAALFYADPGTLTGLNKAPTFPESPGTIKSFMPDRLKYFFMRSESNKHAFSDGKSSV